jgi:hypothetical protein
MTDNYSYDETDYTQSFVFSFKEDNTTLVKQQVFEEGTTWPVVLESFLGFLEASGYIGVKEKVRIEANPFMESDWALGTFDKEEEMQEKFW